MDDTNSGTSPSDHRNGLSVQVGTSVQYLMISRCPVHDSFFLSEKRFDNVANARYIFTPEKPKSLPSPIRPGMKTGSVGFVRRGSNRGME